MALMSEREVFTRTYDVPPEALWTALKRALRTMDLKTVDDAERTARFSTGTTTWSWGQHNLAQVEAQDGRSRLVVRGRPKAAFLTSNFGEKRHAQRVEEQLVEALDEQLRSRPAG